MLPPVWLLIEVFPLMVKVPLAADIVPLLVMLALFKVMLEFVVKLPELVRLVLLFNVSPLLVLAIVPLLFMLPLFNVIACALVNVLVLVKVVLLFTVVVLTLLPEEVTLPLFVMVGLEIVTPAVELILAPLTLLSCPL